MRIDEKNRTEKFWTATVLPALLARQNFEGVSVLLKMIGDDKQRISFDIHQGAKKEMIPFKELCPEKWSYENLQLSTELWYARDFSKNREFAVPDVVLRLCDKYLIVIESKFFQRLKETAINEQLDAQRKTVGDILKTDKSIKYVHHCFLHGGADKVININAHSIITWKEVLDAFRNEDSSSNAITSNNDYFLQILHNALDSYNQEFTPATKKREYYVAQADLIDLIGILHKHGKDAFVGLGVGSPKTAEKTLDELVSAIQEEMDVLKKFANDGAVFEKRPAFLRDKYKGQSAIEYLFKHSSQRYKVDFKNGSGDDKSENKNWVDGARFLNLIKRLTVKEKV